MRFAKGHKEETRRHIVQAAAARFRTDGVEGTGIATLMEDAGLTHGGFYAHFSSKEALVRAALEEGFAENAEKRAGHKDLEELVRSYLRPGHRDTPGKGCIAAALIEEVARGGTETRAVFTKQLRAATARIATLLPAEWDTAQRQARAGAIFALLLGTLQMARAAQDEAWSDALLKHGAEAALRLAHS
ncbi:MAG: TetR/AcrR family transcriptional regulator [Rhodospirillales bacterium]|nr:TetR/AcrR family transcriptional regulator [Rhodospirillales bacterium]MDE2390449.1 TetR/AcrR family transcriptional regulator [Rhodospirillales bacterium]MDE2458346.1 TetR/AcrR family transcriptional regulator [Rhodospirillales bacterium]